MMENNPYFFLPVEINRRELDYKLNIACIMAKKGFKVIIGNPSFIRDELKYKNYRGIFLEKGLNPTPEYYSFLKNKGIYVYDLSDEGLGKNVYSINYEPCLKSLEQVRKIFLWGEEQKKHLSDKCTSNIVKNKMCVVGNPAFDLCFTRYKSVNYLLKSKKLPDSYILVNMNFSSIFSLPEECLYDACKNMSDETIRLIKNERKLDKRIFPVFLEWLKKIITSFPEERFVIRPHPNDLENKYRVIFGKYKNVIISKAGNVNYAISGAKLVLHKDCMTAIQSFLMGVPVISIGGTKFHECYSRWPLVFSHTPEDIDSVIKLIDGFIYGGLSLNFSEKQLNEIEKTLENNFFSLGDSSSALLKEINEDSLELLRDLRPYKLIDDRTFFHKLKLKIVRFLPFLYTRTKISCVVNDAVDKKDIMKRILLFQRNTTPKIKVKKIFIDAFLIYTL